MGELTVQVEVKFDNNEEKLCLKLKSDYMKCHNT